MTRLHQVFVGAAAACFVFGVVPLALLWASRQRFGSASPLARLRPPWSWSSSDAADAVGRPLEDDTVVDLVLRLCLVVGWIGVTVIAVTTVLDVGHLVRNRTLPSPRRPGLRWARPIAHVIALGVVALLPLASRAVAVSPVASVVGRPAAPSGTTDIAPGSDTRDGPLVPETRLDRPPTDTRLAPGEAQYSVVRGDSVWSIAAARSDGTDADTLRIADLILDRNLGVEMSDGATFSSPALIRPGWTLIVPSTTVVTTPSPPIDTPEPVGSVPDTDSTRVVEVVEGDTLSGIAEAELGDPDAWPELADENLGRVMEDGRRFTDPDLILPGWELEVPASDEDTTPTPADVIDQPAPAVDDLDEDRRSDRPDDGLQSDRRAEPDEGASDESGAEPDVIDTAAREPEVAHPSHDAGPELEDWWDTSDDDPLEVTPPASTTTTSTTDPPTVDARGTAASDGSDEAPSPSAPLGLEHAAMLAGGILTLAAVRRRRRLRAAAPHTRLPEPHPSVTATTRSLRTLSRAERVARFDVAIRAAASQLVGTGAQIGGALHLDDGVIEIVTTAPTSLREPWRGSGTTWELPAAIPIELLATDAGRSGQPCPALIAIGRAGDADVLVDLEAAGTVFVDGPSAHADAIVTAIAATLATSVDAETAHLVTSGLPSSIVFEHPNHVEVSEVGDAIAVGLDRLGNSLDVTDGTFDLRVRRTGGEAWEPSIVLCAAGGADDHVAAGLLPEPGRGLAVVSSVPFRDAVRDGVRVIGDGAGWRLLGFGWDLAIEPFGLDEPSIEELTAVVAEASVAPTPIELSPVESSSIHADQGRTDASASAERRIDLVAETDEPRPAVLVRILGGVSIEAKDGSTHDWRRSKTVELIAWLVTHRHRSTRTAARTAMWAQDVRDATFSNVVSEARRGLASLSPPPDAVEWIPRTLTEALVLDDRVVSDIDLLRERLDAARLAAPDQAVALLRPQLDHVRGLPFADTAYLWPDADGLVTEFTLLATSMCTELAEHALSLGDVELVVEATARGLTVLPGHEDLIALRLRAHARAGDLAAVRREWESYERVIDADAWSDGEPAPRLVALRHELLS